MVVRQATCVTIGGRALLIEGPPGSGKSSLALALIDRGATLVGDDGVMLSQRDALLFASPHPQTRGLLEVRNLGLLPVTVCEEAPVCLLIQLDGDAPRYVETPDHVEICGLAIPAIRLWPDSRLLAVKAEMALERYGRDAR